MENKKLLIVEDDPKSLYAFKSVLQDRGFQVVACIDAEQALAHIDHAFHAAILDVRLPGQSGVELAALLRKAQPGLRVVFVTAYNGVSSLRALFPDCTAMVKPIDIQQLLHAL